MPDQRSYFRSLPSLGESNQDYRERLEALKAEDTKRRQQQIDEQSSPLNCPSVRIKAWERLHQLDLPRDPAHRLVNVIAANTGLTVDEVRGEQTSRAAGPSEIETPRL
jgi:hypothetical protein